MNKRNFFIACITVCSYITMTAQTVIIKDEKPEERSTSANAWKTTWKKNKFKDTWFLQVGIGGQTIFAEDDDKGSLTGRTTLAPSLTIGKYFSPIWALQLKITGGSIHGWNDGDAGYYTYWNSGSKHYAGDNNGPTFDPSWVYRGWAPDYGVGAVGTGNDIILNPSRGWMWGPGQDHSNGQNLYMQHTRYFAGNVDFMFDLLTLFGNYNPKRVFDIGVFAGPGFYHTSDYYGNPAKTLVGANMGLQAKIHMGKVGLFLEFNGDIVSEEFDGHFGDDVAVDGLGHLSLGLNLRLGKHTWEIADPYDYEYIMDLNRKVEEYRQKYEECQTATVEHPDGTVNNQYIQYKDPATGQTIIIDQARGKQYSLLTDPATGELYFYDSDTGRKIVVVRDPQNGSLYFVNPTTGKREYIGTQSPTTTQQYPTFPSMLNDPYTGQVYPLVQNPGQAPYYQGPNGQALPILQDPTTGGYVVTLPNGMQTYVNPTQGGALGGVPQQGTGYGYGTTVQQGLPPQITDPSTGQVYPLVQNPGQQPYYAGPGGRQLPVYQNPTGGYVVQMPNGQPLYLNGQPQGTAVYPGQTGTVYPGQATGYGVQPQASFPQYITDPNTRMQYTLVPGSTTPTYRGANGQVVTGSQTPGGWVVTFPSGTTQYLSGPPTTGYAAQGQVALPPTITDPTTRAVYTLQQIPGQAPVYINQYGQQLPVYMNPTTGSYTVTYPNGQIYYLGQQTGTVQSYNCQTPIVFLPDPVFFRIDKSVIDRGEWNKIAKAASYLNNNPGVRIVVTGYADRQTAYPAYNLKLSEKRAKTVSKALVERYGINPTRISVHWEGDYVQPFSINEWNRVVIFVIE